MASRAPVTGSVLVPLGQRMGSWFALAIEHHDHVEGYVPDG